MPIQSIPCRLSTDWRRRWLASTSPPTLEAACSAPTIAAKAAPSPDKLRSLQPPRPEQASGKLWKVYTSHLEATDVLESSLFNVQAINGILCINIFDWSTTAAVAAFNDGFYYASWLTFSAANIISEGPIFLQICNWIGFESSFVACVGPSRRLEGSLSFLGMVVSLPELRIQREL